MSDNETPPKYQPAPPLRGESLVNHSDPVRLRVPLVDDQPPQQQRWTIAFRLLLAFPQFIVLLFVLIGAYLIAIVAWFAALFTGRVPDGLASYLRMTIRWATRVNAYTYLLTDLYPPFHGDEDTDYPIGIELPDAVPLNRLSVLFRIILIVPAGFMSLVITSGMSVFLFFYWIAALLLGRLPDPVYRAVATQVRFQQRMTSFLFMLTPEYPWGWKGDAAAELTSPTTEPTSTSGYWGATTDVSATVMPTETSRFNFVLTGWALSWIWIYVAVGVLYQILTRR